MAPTSRSSRSEVSMTDPNKRAPARGNILIDTEECKGCGLCVESCPPECLDLLPELKAYGVHPAHYAGGGCTGCGICFYCCPEPGAISVYRLPAAKKPASQPTTQSGGSHAPDL